MSLANLVAVGVSIFRVVFLVRAIIRANKSYTEEPGTDHAYFTYGMYYCFNISSNGDGAVVFIRDLKQISGLKEQFINMISF